MTGVALCTELGDLYESRLTVGERSGRKDSAIRSLVLGKSSYVWGQPLVVTVARDPPIIRVV